MFIITGATGHVGSSVLRTLMSKNEDVIAITHSLMHVAKLKLAGAGVEYVDIADTDKLALSFSRGETLFMLNPPGDVSKDAVAIEKESVRTLLEALNKSSVKRVVAESTQGARSGDGIGDLGVLYELEQGLAASGRAVRITRADYYMSNWDLQAESVEKTGVLQSFMPADFKLSMVAPDDIGRFNAQQMLEDFEGFKIANFSGPAPVSANDVAREFSRVFNRDVRVEVTPREKWVETYIKQGFSPEAAKSYAEMTRITVDEFKTPPDIVRGTTTLREYFDTHYAKREHGLHL